MEGTNISEIGKFLRGIRIDHNENQKEMSARLGVTPAFLSAVEIGKKQMSSNLATKLVNEYSLSASSVQELIESAYRSRRVIKISLSDVSGVKRDLAIKFASDFDRLTSEDAKEILQILERKTA